MHPFRERMGFQVPKDSSCFIGMSRAQEPSAGCRRAFLGGVDFSKVWYVGAVLRARRTPSHRAQRNTACQRPALVRLGYRRGVVSSDGTTHWEMR